MLKSLYLQFAAQVKDSPDAICFIDDKNQLTYQQALYHVLDIANKLHSKGVKKGDVLGIYSEKNIESILCFLATSYLGATVLTLDVAFPEKMIRFILDDANVNWLITNSEINFTPSIEQMSLPHLVSINPAIKKPALNLFEPDSSNNIAWIVYSSGTTGNPKGIEISNQAILNSIFSRYDFSDYKKDDVVLCCIYFYWEIFRPLFRGAAAYILTDDKLLDFKEYLKIIQKQQITETLWTPSFAQMLLQCISNDELPLLSSLKQVWLNGEVVCRQLAELTLEKLPTVNFFNLYSISETFDVTAMPIHKQKISKNGFASIGRPLKGVSTWILDNEHNISPLYHTGELYISSLSLAKGYLNREDLNKESFIKIEKIAKNERIFKTKDIAYKNSDGEIFILGRNDHIVKLRGYNISLLAIEDIIKRVLPIKECIVDIIGTNPVEQTIACTISPQNPAEFINKFNLDETTGISSTLQNLLADSLPHYAVPTKFFLLETVQWNKYSAKVNRKASSLANNLQNKTENLAENQNSNEDKLRQIWHKLLHVPSQAIELDSDFFAYGANSLHIMQYIQQISDVFNIQLSLAKIYQFPDFKDHLNWIEDNTVESFDVTNQIQKDLEYNFSTSYKNSRCSNLQDAKNVLITGVTGFLGAHWLAHLLETTNCKYYCLIRATNPQEGLLRIKKVFQRYNLNTTLLEQRIIIKAGALEEKQLGLNEDDWNFLINNIDIILHIAAKVNMLASYQQLRPGTVEGTKTLLKLATTFSLKPFILISSDAVSKNCTSQSLDLNSVNELTYGYAQSKWVQEKLVEKASNCCQLPYLIFRLGNLSPSLKTGAKNSFDANHMLMKFIKNEQVMLDKISIEFTPVDKIVQYLTNKCKQKKLDKIYSLSSFNVVDSNIIKSFFSDINFKIIDFVSWSALLKIKEPILYALWEVDSLFVHHVYSPFTNALLTLSSDQLQQSLDLLSDSTDEILIG